MKTPKIKPAILIMLVFFSSVFIGQPDPPGSGHGSDNNEGAGGGAPIGSGVITLLVLSVIWGGNKLYVLHKEDLEN